MHNTKHLAKRMSQRGIKQEMLDLVYKYGKISGDKIILDRKETQKVINIFDESRKTIQKTGMAIVIFNEITYNFKGKEINILLDKLNTTKSGLMKIMDKGGITLAIDNNTAITAYNNY